MEEIPNTWNTKLLGGGKKIVGEWVVSMEKGGGGHGYSL